MGEIRYSLSLCVLFKSMLRIFVKDAYFTIWIKVCTIIISIRKLNCNWTVTERWQNGGCSIIQPPFQSFQLTLSWMTQVHPVTVFYLAVSWGTQLLETKLRGIPPSQPGFRSTTPLPTGGQMGLTTHWKKKPNKLTKLLHFKLILEVRKSRIYWEI